MPVPSDAVPTRLLMPGPWNPMSMATPAAWKLASPWLSTLDPTRQALPLLMENPRPPKSDRAASRAGAGVTDKLYRYNALEVVS